MDLISPSSIFYPPYLISAIVIGLLWIKYQAGNTWKKSFQIFFSKDLWFSKEVLIDFFCCLFIILILKKCYAPIEDWIFSHQIKFLSQVKSPVTFKLSSISEAVIVTMVTMLSIDAASYVIHRSMHTHKWLWRTHKFHHTVTHLNFFSTYRQNPFEFLILNIARIMSAASGLSIFYWFFPAQTPVILIEGLGAGFFIYMFTVNLHHSHIPVRYPPLLRFILISPHVHHLHHSANPSHYGKNYGVVFSVWDRMFQTYYEKDVACGELRFGNAQLLKK